MLSVLRAFSVSMATASAVAVAMSLFTVTASAQEGFEMRSFQGSNNVTLPYRLFKPENAQPGVKYPLIMFLHGAGERGDNNMSQVQAGSPNGAVVWSLPANQAKNPAYIIAPQCPSGQQWVDTDWTKGTYSTADVPISDELTAALELYDAIAAEFSTDSARHYITGLSMGGYGTWDAIARFPDRFTAAIPICGGGDTSRAEALSKLPIWTAHGDVDSVVPVSGSREMVAALKAAGSAVKYDEYPGVDHNAWDPTYQNQDVIDWLFEQKKPSMGGAAGEGGAGGDAAAGGAEANGATGQGGVAAMGGVPSAQEPVGGAAAGTGGETAGPGEPVTGGAAGDATVPATVNTADDSGDCAVAQRSSGAPWGAGLIGLFTLATLGCMRVLRKKGVNWPAT